MNPVNSIAREMGNVEINRHSNFLLNFVISLDLFAVCKILVLHGYDIYSLGIFPIILRNERNTSDVKSAAGNGNPDAYFKTDFRRNVPKVNICVTRSRLKVEKLIVPYMSSEKQIRSVFILLITAGHSFSIYRSFPFVSVIGAPD